MKHWFTLSLVLGGLLFGFQPAVADDDDENGLSFGLGFGLVNIDEEEISDDVENYYLLNLRVPVGDDEGRSSQAWSGHLEPEVGYWEGDNGEDLLAGVNLVGVVPMSGADFFVGGGIGLHFVDVDVVVDGQRISSNSEESIGVNAQFGVDVQVGDNVSLFGAGRFDLVEDADALQAKAYVGVRFGG